MEEYEGQGRQQQQGEGGGEVEHEAESHQGGIDQDDHQNGAHGDEPLNQADVRDGAGHHVANAVLGEEPHPLLLQALVKTPPQVKGHQLPSAAHHVAGLGDHQIAGQDGNGDAERRTADIPAAAADPIDALRQKEGHQPLKQARQAKSGNANGKAHPIRPNERPKAQQGLQNGHGLRPL